MMLVAYMFFPNRLPQPPIAASCWAASKDTPKSGSNRSKCAVFKPRTPFLRKGLIGSQVGYEVGEVQVHLMEKLGVAALDMEAAAIAQILMQTGTNFIAVKVISNGIYPDDAARMEAEYQTHKAAVSQKAVQVLEQLIDYLQGKTPAAC